MAFLPMIEDENGPLLCVCVCMSFFFTPELFPLQEQKQEFLLVLLLLPQKEQRQSQQKRLEEHPQRNPQRDDAQRHRAW